jgi:hypothetical protein
MKKPYSNHRAERVALLDQRRHLGLGMFAYVNSLAGQSSLRLAGKEQRVGSCMIKMRHSVTGRNSTDSSQARLEKLK